MDSESREPTARHCYHSKTPHQKKAIEFKQVKNPEKAAKLLMPHAEEWGGFIVMNRTFYRLNTLTCAYLTERGMVYADEASDSVVTLGSRFMPWQSLHIGLITGNHEKCLSFSYAKGLEEKVGRLSMLFPPERNDVQASVTEFGFKISPEDFITMGIEVKHTLK
jgi:hypothetical protein